MVCMNRQHIHWQDLKSLTQSALVDNLTMSQTETNASGLSSRFSLVCLSWVHVQIVHTGTELIVISNSGPYPQYLLS